MENGKPVGNVALHIYLALVPSGVAIGGHHLNHEIQTHHNRSNKSNEDDQNETKKHQNKNTQTHIRVYVDEVVDLSRVGLHVEQVVRVVGGRAPLGTVAAVITVAGQRAVR